MPVFFASRASKAARPAGFISFCAISSFTRLTLIRLQLLRFRRGVKRIV